MLKSLPFAALGVLLSAIPAAAQEFTGGELSLEYNFDADNSGSNSTSYSGGVEFAFGREYAIGVSVAGVNLGDDDQASSMTLHGLYHLSSTATVGAFYSQGEDDASAFGVQGGTVFGSGEIGGYIGQRSFGDTDVIAFGLESRTPFMDQFVFFTDFDLVADNDAGVSTNELGVTYTFDQGPEAFVQVGQATAYANGSSVSDEYIGFGARISFGAKRGTTFDAR